MILAEELQRRIDVAIVEEHNKEERRGYLGASQLGKPCDRAVWLTFHWATIEKLDARKIRLFDRGHKEEDRVYKWLEPIAEQVLPLNPKTGKQWKATAHNGILSGSCDGAVKIDGLWYLLEVKTHNADSFKDLKKLKSIKVTKPQYWTQVHLYMGMMKLPAAIHINDCKNDDDMYIEVIPFDADYFTFEHARALDIILDDTGEASIKISEASNWWQCNMCNHKSVCKGGAMPDRNCRTCRHCVPAQEETWICNGFDKPLALPKNEQITRAVVCDGYQPHAIFIPENNEVMKFSLDSKLNLK